MAVLRNPLVSIVKCTNYNNSDDVGISVERSLDLIGGIESIVSPGDCVLIKPNVLKPALYTTGATTNPHIVKAIANLCTRAGAKRVIIAEGAAIGQKASEAFEVCGYGEVAKECSCELIDFNNDSFQLVVNPSGSVFRRIRVPESFLEANVVINVPVMKTHDALGVTLGLKNMKGIIHVSDKKRFHKWGLAQSIIDLNKIALPELTIMDGTVAMEGDGPAAGDPVGLGLIMASTDTVACDRVASEIMGFGEDELEYIKMASEQGLGCFDLSEIKVVGEQADNVKRPFKRITLNREKLEELGINLLSCDACSGCSHVVKSYMLRLEKQNRLESLKGWTIVYGQSAYIPEDAKGKIMAIGTCTRKLSGADCTYVPGCPPHPLHIDDKL